MVDIIEFKTREAEQIEQSESNIKEILNEVLEQVPSIKDIVIFIVDKSEQYLLFNTETLTLPDKSFLVQLIQNNINNELNQPDEDQLELDL